MDIETVFSICDAYQYLELDQSLPFWIRTRAGDRIACFSYQLRARGDDVIAWIPEVVLLDVTAEGTESSVERILLDLELTIEPPSTLCELEEGEYAVALSELHSGASWDEMRTLVCRAEPTELLPLYDVVCAAISL